MAFGSRAGDSGSTISCSPSAARKRAAGQPSLSAVAARAAQISLMPGSRNSPSISSMRAASILSIAFMPRLPCSWRSRVVDGERGQRDDDGGPNATSTLDGSVRSSPPRGPARTPWSRSACSARARSSASQPRSCARARIPQPWRDRWSRPPRPGPKRAKPRTRERKASAREELLAIDEVQQRHRLAAQRMDDMPVIDDNGHVCRPVRACAAAPQR